jgi:hypothetical protein
VTDEPGYTPEELERGEDQAWHIPICGCLLAFGGLVLILWLMFTHGFFMHGD